MTVDGVGGKPAIGPIVKTSLPAESISELEVLAIVRGTTKAALIRDAIVRYLDAEVLETETE